MDADATAFIAVASITDNAQKAAVNQLVLDLKAAGVWSKLKAAYPFVGGTATSHKWNLKDPRDLDAAFRLTFAGGWTHSATGADPDGTTGYADTKWSPATQASVNNISMGFYSRTADQAAGARFDMGCADASFGQTTCIIPRHANNRSYWCFGSLNFQTSATYDHDGTGLFYGVRSSDSTKGYRNGTLKAQAADLPAVLPDISVYLGATHQPAGPVRYTGREFAFAAMGEALTAGEAAGLYTAVQSFQTTLGRQV